MKQTIKLTHEGTDYEVDLSAMRKVAPEPPEWDGAKLDAWCVDIALVPSGGDNVRLIEGRSRTLGSLMDLADMQQLKAAIQDGINYLEGK